MQPPTSSATAAASGRTALPVTATPSPRATPRLEAR
jgi:hypothetical protein